MLSRRLTIILSKGFDNVLFVNCYKNVFSAWGLAKAEGDATLWDGGDERTPETHYHLSGIVVHSGQASGGHYYSYVLLR